MDRKFKMWLTKLHPSMNWRLPHKLSDNPTLRERCIAYQRHICAAYYLGTFMNLHRPYLMQAPPILPPPRGAHAVTSAVMNPSRERCIELAMELVTVLCDAQEEAARWDTDPPVPFVVFHYAYFVFDGAVALIGALTQDPPHPKARECFRLIDRATRLLERCKEANRGATDGEGDMASRAVTVLGAFRKAGRWDERFSDGAAAGAHSNGPHGRSAHNSATRGTAESPTTSSNPFSYSSTMPIAGSSSFSPFSELAAMGSACPIGPPTSSFPFLNSGRPGPSMPPLPMPGPIQMQSSASMPVLFGDVREPGTGLDASIAAPIMDFGAGTSAGVGAKSSMQTMVMPFDMLQNSDSYEIDWAAVMGSDGWPGDSSSGAL